MNANDLPVPDVDSAAHILQGAIGQIKFARQYTLGLLDATPQELWFRIPEGLPTNVVWQIGHLAVSQYGLLMFRVRGRSPDDLTLIPGKFRKKYSRQTTPTGDETVQPTADELIDKLATVHDLALGELATVAPEVLLEPIDEPYAAYPIKLGAILFCPLHEHIHIGQIGLIRRALGLEPVR